MFSHLIGKSIPQKFNLLLCQLSSFSRIISVTLGRPLALRLEDIDVSLPSVEGIDHQYREVYQQDTINSSTSPTANNDYPNEDQNSESLSRYSESSTQMAIFIQIVRFRIFCGKVLVALHPNTSYISHSEYNISSLQERLAAELEEWRQQSSTIRFSDVHLSSSLLPGQSSYCSKEWFEMMYQTATLLLYRPSPLISDISMDGVTLQKIFTAARRCILLYSCLYRTRRINYSWITLHTAFMCGLSYIYVVGRHLREKRKILGFGRHVRNQDTLLCPEPSVIDIVNDTRACSNILVAVSARWNSPGNCQTVFDRLSNAVVADAVRLQSSSINNPPRISESGYSLPVVADASPQSSSMNNPPQTSECDHSLQAAGDSFFSDSNYQNFASLSIDSEFHNCLDDLQNLYHPQYIDDPVMQLSQDWLNDIGGMEPIYHQDLSSEQFSV